MKIEEMPNEPVSIYFPGPVAVYSLHQPDNREIPYCWAMVSHEPLDEHEAVLWMVYTRQQFRRRGYAKRLIGDLQKRYTRIMTQYELLNSAGSELCLSCGFRIKESVFRKKPSQLIWEKGK